MDPMRRMSDADRAGFVARSPEGHAARSMSIKGQEEVSLVLLIFGAQILKRT